MKYNGWSIKQVHGAARVDAMAFIAAQFAQHFGARVEDDTEEVYTVTGPDGQLEAAFGLNRDRRRFFAHHYVPDMNSALAEAYDDACDAHARVVEFAHLCARSARSVCLLVPVLAEFLAQRADFIVCTATRELAALFSRKGLAANVLATACAERLPGGQRTFWGTYYEHDPVVLSGRLVDVCDRLHPPELAVA